jgi:hypothetical protein
MHDMTMRALCEALQSVGADVVMEPVAVFAQARAAALEMGATSSRIPPQWRRPDFSVRFPGGADGTDRLRYYEWKTCTLAEARYPTTNSRGGRWGAQGRADAEQAFYDRAEVGSGSGAARTLDNQILQLGGRVGPYQQRWRDIGGVTVLAMGAYGEVSRSVQDLLAAAANYGARHMWSKLGCETEAEARGRVGELLHTRCGTVFVTEQAYLLERRLYLAMPGGGDSDHRQVAVRERMQQQMDAVSSSHSHRGGVGSFEHWR